MKCGRNRQIEYKMLFFLFFLQCTTFALTIVLSKKEHKRPEGVCAMESGLKPLNYNAPEHGAVVQSMLLQAKETNAWIGLVHKTEFPGALSFLNLINLNWENEDKTWTFQTILKEKMYLSGKLEEYAAKRVFCVVDDSTAFQSSSHMFIQHEL